MFPIWLHASLQVLDGILTYLGVKTFNGINAEGNPLVRKLMEHLGVVEALILIKLIAFLALFMLWKHKRSDEVMLKRILIPLNFLYILSALGWIYILLKNYRVIYG